MTGLGHLSGLSDDDLLRAAIRYEYEHFPTPRISHSASCIRARYKVIRPQNASGPKKPRLNKSSSTCT